MNENFINVFGSDGWMRVNIRQINLNLPYPRFHPNFGVMKIRLIEVNGS